MSDGLRILKALQKQGLAVTRTQDGKRMGDAEVASLIESADAQPAPLTPGQKVIQEFNKRNYAVMTCDSQYDYGSTDDNEIAGLIESYSGVAALMKALDDLLVLPERCVNEKEFKESDLHRDAARVVLAELRS